MANRDSEPALLEDRLMSLAIEGTRMFSDQVLDDCEQDRLYEMFHHDLPLIAVHVAEIRLAARVRARVDRCGPRNPIDKHIQSELDDISRRKSEILSRKRKQKPTLAGVGEAA